MVHTNGTEHNQLAWGPIRKIPPIPHVVHTHMIAFYVQEVRRTNPIKSDCAQPLTAASSRRS